MNSRALGILLKNCSKLLQWQSCLALLDKALSISETDDDLVETAYVKKLTWDMNFLNLNNYEESEKII